MASFPLRLPLPCADVGRRPNVGELVVLAPSASADGCLGNGQGDGRLGRLTTDDHSSLPFLVECIVGPEDQVGQKSWHREGQIAVYTGPAPPAFLRSLLEAPPTGMGVVGPGNPAPTSFPVSLPLPISGEGRRPRVGELVVLLPGVIGQDPSSALGSSQADGRLVRRAPRPALPCAAGGAAACATRPPRHAWTLTAHSLLPARPLAFACSPSIPVAGHADGG